MFSSTSRDYLDCNEYFNLVLSVVCLHLFQFIQNFKQNTFLLSAEHLLVLLIYVGLE